MDRDYLYFGGRNSYGCTTEKGIDNVYYRALEEGTLETLRETNDCIVDAVKI
jgi:hypothetical protein